MFYNLTNADGAATLAITSNDGTFSKVIAGNHPNFAALLGALTTDPIDEDQVKALADPGKQISEALSEFTDRVVYRDGSLFFDGLPLHNALGRHLLTKIEANDSDYERFVLFLLNLDENPSRNAQQATYTWIEKNGLTITEDGCFLGYKAVKRDFLSSFSGPDNFVDGVLLDEGRNVRVPHKIGSVISKKRADVDDTPGGGCSVGLHVGTQAYARDFAPVQVTVKVNPRDVVSAPNGDLEYKIRVCRYEVISLNSPEQFSRPSYDTPLPTETPDTDEAQIAFAKVTANQVKSRNHDDWEEGDQDDYDGLTAAGRTLYDNLRTQFDWDHLDALVAAAHEFPVPVVVEEEPQTIAVSFDGSPVSERLVVPEAVKPTLTDWAEANPVLMTDLADKSLGHKPLARKWADVTTESSVRRFRKAAGIKVSLGAKVAR